MSASDDKGRPMTSVIIDTDIGIDDAMAFAYLSAKPGVEISAVNSVHGNCDVETATSNALRALDFLGLTDVPVARGASAPMKRPLKVRKFAHGEDGMGDSTIGESSRQVTGEHAADQLVRLANERPGEHSLLALGPLTNLALALEKDREVLTKLARIVIMGGSGPFPTAGTFRQEDTNIEHDPEAAEIVFAAEAAPTELVGVCVTTATVLEESQIQAIADAPSRAARLVTSILPKYLDFYQHKWSRRICSLHDPTAAVVLTEPDLSVKDRIAGPINVIDDGSNCRAWLMVREDGGDLIHDGTANPDVDVPTAVDQPFVASEFTDIVMEAN